ncbi:MAG TPA: hypothetical protein DCS07_06555 [Bdellovibrionales bacterium]|nr:MAG: hypothetical protein A2Z97_13510 [Bdellovibrionales bacterium GWB1_52_6]OFZ06082.1 MAG: hypothetical protein A2X97_01975 [Bdellovibrionales bacterium GWA1_52_35]OFZ34170.1 MAG: hypothetical protein A2070_01775 [Bdellovibrionales bacterium GWC1_52_8]HAR42278.1 hypothetical protein [Bdellovibrionales bacterium]HCM39291.1 hypothetical protein [Bdellovibrionales bacterium]
MGSIRVREKERSQGGVALFMVLAAVAALSLLVTEFAYIAQLNQKIAFDSLDQVKVHYLAKSALKLSLLRLKAYQQVKSLIGKQGGAIGAVIPRAVIEKIWNFPFIYPLPSNIPGMTLTEKDKIDTFQKESMLEGSFTAAIESESGKYNLNMLLAPFVPKPVPSTGPSPNPTPSAAPTFDPNEAQNSLTDYLEQLVNNKFEADPDFAEEYRDLKMIDLSNNIRAWVDPTFERPYVPGGETVAFKRSPFSTLSELHMITGMTDDLYSVFAPALTVSTTPGINVNTMNEYTLRALFPGVTPDETKEFLEFRDSEEEDHSFKKDEDFLKYVVEHFAAFRSVAFDQLKAGLLKRNIRLVVDETNFKITVQARLNQSVRLIEVWVTLVSEEQSKSKDTSKPLAPSGAYGSRTDDPEGEVSNKKSNANTGLNITFMRIL